MNGGAGKIGFIIAVGACALTGALALAGCMADPTTAASPISAQIAAAVAAPARPPSFADVPQRPTDLRQPVQWREVVGAEEAERRRILAAGDAGSFALKGDTEAFAARARAEATRGAPAAPTAADRKASEDYAASLREQASPPSSPR